LANVRLNLGVLFNSPTMVVVGVMVHR